MCRGDGVMVVGCICENLVAQCYGSRLVCHEVWC